MASAPTVNPFVNGLATEYASLSIEEPRSSEPKPAPWRVVSKRNSLELYGVQFNPSWRITFTDLNQTPPFAKYEDFKSKVLQAQKTKNFKAKILFDEENGAVLIGHSLHEFRILIDEHREIAAFFERRRNALHWKDNRHYRFQVALQYLKGDLEEEVQTLVEIAKAKLSPYADIDTSSFNLSQAVFDVFTTYQGMIIGGSLTHRTAYAFLTQNMQAFAAHGVRTLFVEYLIKDTMQGDLDQFHKSGAMSANLSYYLKHLFHEVSDSCNLLEVVTEARKWGIKVIGIDTHVSYMIEFGLGGNTIERNLSLNYNALKFVEQEKGEGKFIVFADFHRVSTYMESNTQTKVPGLSEILGCPNLIIEDGFNGESLISFHIENFKSQLRHIHLHARITS